MTASFETGVHYYYYYYLLTGASPYPGMAGPDVMEFVQKGCRMEKPRHCSDTMYVYMGSIHAPIFFNTKTLRKTL